MIIRILLLLTSSVIIYSNIAAQVDAGMRFLNFPFSVASMGMGENSVAVQDNYSALNFNPANLIFTERPEVSFYHQQFTALGRSYPLNSFSGYINFRNIGILGIQYMNQDWGETTLFNPDLTINKRVNSYDRNISLGFSRSFSDEFTAGIAVIFAHSKLAVVEVDHWFISTGLNYTPQYFSRKIMLGFSLTNFSNKINYKYENNKDAGSDPAPSMFNAGINYTPLINRFLSVGLNISISKGIISNRDENNLEIKSSFKELFSDWKDFPRDANVHTGISFEWKPLDIGNDFSFFQKFYIGEKSSGPKNFGGGFFTHGALWGVDYNGFRLTGGYTGVWHLVHFPEFTGTFLNFPMEGFQFTLSVNASNLSGNFHTIDHARLKNFIVALGAGESLRSSRYKNEFAPDNGNNPIVFLEGAFYINERNALVSSINYSQIPYEPKYNSIVILKSKIETFVFTSQYRYHPFEGALPFYFQGGLGIIRYNPRIKTSPRYEYKSSVHLAAGTILDMLQPFIINPEAAYILVFNTAGNKAPRLGGYNQFDLIMKLGYRF